MKSPREQMESIAEASIATVKTVQEHGRLLQSHALLLQAIASTPSLQQQIAERYSLLLLEQEKATGLKLPVVLLE